MNIAHAWLIQNYGETVVAVPGASAPRHATEAAGALDVSLSGDELARPNEMSAKLRAA